MKQLVHDIAEAIRKIDQSGQPFKQFQPGVGPYGEPQLVKLITKHLSTSHPSRYPRVKTCRTPDVLVPSLWAIEFKIVRPFGDNGVEAEHWSQNLLHPYEGNVSAIGDALKLLKLDGVERKAVIVIGYEHEPSRRPISVLIDAFELLTKQLLKIPMGIRHEEIVAGCVHPVHQCASIYGWEILPQT